MNRQILHKTQVIKCPHCNCEYLPGEIFMPGSLIGQPTEIVKDGFGKILYEDYEPKTKEPSLTEHFVCENCNKPFIIEAIVSYKSLEESEERDFSNKYVSLLD